MKEKTPKHGVTFSFTASERVALKAIVVAAIIIVALLFGPEIAGKVIQFLK